MQANRHDRRSGCGELFRRLVFDGRSLRQRGRSRRHSARVASDDRSRTAANFGSYVSDEATHTTNAEVGNTHQSPQAKTALASTRPMVVNLYCTHLLSAMSFRVAVAPAHRLQQKPTCICNLGHVGDRFRKPGMLLRVHVLGGSSPTMALPVLDGHRRIDLAAANPPSSSPIRTLSPSRFPPRRH